MIIFFIPRKTQDQLSGKTRLAGAVLRRVGGDVQILHLSFAIKRAYAQTHGSALNLEDRGTKTSHRADLVRFAEKRLLSEDTTYWCREVWRNVNPYPSCLLITDARRSADLAYFCACTECTTVRIECSDTERRKRGWVHDPRVDDACSETGLDDASFDVRIHSPFDADTHAERIGGLLNLL